MPGKEDTKKMEKDKLDILKKIGDLKTQKKFLDLEEESIELERRIQEVEQRLVQLEEKLRRKEKLTYSLGAYWLPKDNGFIDGPYCPRCRDAENRLILLRDKGSDISRASWICEACATGFIVIRREREEAQDTRMATSH